jgi:hypothetical protein
MELVPSNWKYPLHFRKVRSFIFSFNTDLIKNVRRVVLEKS